MFISHILAGVIGLAVSADASPLVDLTKIERRLGKEPVYESKRPQYCLLVFGAKAEPRVWVVLDGDLLYLDRNGNGDLTEPGERISSDQALRRPEDRPDLEVSRSFTLHFPAKNRSKQASKGPILSCGPELVWFHVERFLRRAELRDDPHWEGYWKRPFRVALAEASEWEQDAQVAFADRAEDAPILHFLGPLQVTWSNRARPEFRRGEKAEFLVRLTTPGVNGTVRTYGGIPAGAHPVADLEFPAGRPGGAPIRQHAELTTPC